MSDTPRTDAIVIGGTAERLLSMCRMLERELAQMNLDKAEFDALKTALAAAKTQAGKTYEQVDAEVRDELQAANERLAAALDAAREGEKE